MAFSINVLSLRYFLALTILFFIKLYHDVGASFIPTAPPVIYQVEIRKVVEKADVKVCLQLRFKGIKRIEKSFSSEIDN